MATKISGVDGVQIASVGAGRAVPRPRDAAADKARDASDSDSSDVQITGTARTLASLEQAVRDLPAVNEARVAQLRTAIEQGTYTVRPEHLADQLIQLEQALGQLPDAAEPDAASLAQPSGE
ncbi:MAG: flagellar biosynthesis anti-sigma factor FlgM [Steroidobacteraceae bacterium]